MSEAEPPAADGTAAQAGDTATTRTGSSLHVALGLLPATLIVISTVLPWSETLLRVVSAHDLPSLGVVARHGGSELTATPWGLNDLSGQAALIMGLVAAVLAALRRGRELVFVSAAAVVHASMALFVLVQRSGADHVASFERLLAADPSSAQASISSYSVQPGPGVLLYLTAAYLLLLSTSWEGAGVPLQGRIAAAIDRFNSWLGTGVAWLTLAMVLCGAYNAIARKLDQYIALSLSSNAFIEAQWYMFSVVFLLGAAWTLRENGHVRVDVMYGRLGPVGKARIDLAGTLLFLLPFCVAALWFTLPSVLNSWQIHEISPDPGGLPRYPLKMVLPATLVFLALQGHALAVGYVGILQGRDGTGSSEAAVEHSEGQP